MTTTHPVSALSPFHKEDILNVVVETPAGSRAKLKYEPETGLFGISKMLPEGFVFPFDFGFVPGTQAEDGDPLDVMLIAEVGTVTGCLVKARPLGVLKMEETKEDRKGKGGGSDPVRNDRILAVPLASRRYGELAEMDDLPGATREQIEFFLTSYGKLDGKILRMTGAEDARAAVKLVRKATKPPY